MATPITAPTVPLSFLFLAAQVSPKRSTLDFVSINKSIQPLVAHVHIGRDLNRAQFIANEVSSDTQTFIRNTVGIPRSFGALQAKLLRLLRTITSLSTISGQLTANRGSMPIQKRSNFQLVMSYFHQCVNLITFMLTEVFICHGNFNWESKAMMLKHPQSPVQVNQCCTSSLNLRDIRQS